MKFTSTLLIIIGLILAPLAGSDFVQAQESQADTPTPARELKPFATISCEKILADEKKVADVAAAVAASDWWAQIQLTVSNIMVNVLRGNSLYYRLRCDPVISGYNFTTKTPTASIYNASKNLVNFGVLIILLVIAFANILRIKLDTYAVKKAVPLLLFGVVMANLGLPIIRTIVDFSEVLAATFIHQSSIDGTKTGFVKELISATYRGGLDTLATTINSMGQGSNAWTAALGLIGIGFAWSAFGPFAILVLVGGAFLIMLPAIFFFLLGLLFVARVYFLVILAAVSPLAFATLGFEPLRSKVWGWWWKHFISWTFMVPVAFGMFWLGILFFRSVGGKMDIGTYILILFVFYQAIQLPIKMGTSVMGFWNSSVVKPVAKGLFSGFSAGRDYVAKAGPRDTSRFLSSKTTGNLIPTKFLRDRAGILGRIPLNPAKSVREGVGLFATTVEERNAANEKASPATAVGVGAGQFFSSVRTQGVKGALATARNAGLATSVEGRLNLRNKAAEKVRRHGFDPGHDWNEAGYDKEKTSFQEGMKAAIDSNNAEEIGAYVMAHAELKIDKLDTALEQAVQKLGNSGVDSKRLLDFYSSEYKKNTGISTTAAGTYDERYTQTLGKLRADLAALSPKKQEEYLGKVLTKLNQAVGTLNNIQEIEKNPNYKAWAKVLLTESQSHDEIRKNIAPLEQHRGQLNAVAIESIARSLPGLAQAMQQTARATGNNLQLTQLQPLLSGFDSTRFATELKPEEQFAAIVAYEKHVEDLKNAMQSYLTREFDKIEKQMQLRNGSLRSVAGAQIGKAGALPQKIDAAVLQAAGVADPDKSAQIVNQLEWYNNMVTSLDTLKTEQATNGPRIAQMIKNHQTGGQTGANSPERQAIAQQLTNLRTALNERPEGLLNELPAELQKQIRAQVALQPITSGGLERVKSLMTRLNWAIFYLNDPDFPPKDPSPEKLVETVPTAPSPPSSLEAPPTKPNDSLNFGPFDPRGRN